ncbi:MAG TPA: A/G-specific adenine glycosylase [Firmicutes bacterium]|nr:A/G-specific adenine glycosylase [Bacillota bacterium]
MDHEVYEQLKAAREPLLLWYDTNQRELPWRGNVSPYETWISEIMLQQTRVEAVKEYYRRFLERFPDIPTLAAADRDEVYCLWQGLGYYRRADMLHKAAKIVTEQYGGVLPGDHRSLLSLPGIGRYTAGAIASIGFGLPYPAVDGNVLRVIMRLLGRRDDIAEERLKTTVEQWLKEIYPRDRAGDFTQALMELGAIVCVPNGAPLCEECPWRKLCCCNAEGNWQEIPVKSGKKSRKIEEKTVFLLRYDNAVALHRRDREGLLANLWEFPNALGHWTEQEVIEHFPGAKIKKVGKAKHVFTHIEWHMIGYEIWFRQKKKPLDLIWVEKTDLEQYAIPAAFKAFKKAL